tara:strand:+ start:2583 stop:2915 length:333 start_codon:yes stop_codon:yes gene_type:complete
MIQKRIKHGNTIFSDGTYSRTTVFVCETMEEFISLLHNIQTKSSAPDTYEADIRQKTIKVKEWVSFMANNDEKILNIIENTKLEYDDGITEEMWDAAEKAINEIHGDEEE